VDITSFHNFEILADGVIAKMYAYDVGFRVQIGVVTKR
jgi:hypothetical protein